MKRIALALMLALPMMAQDKPEPTIAELKIRLAQKDVEIATLKKQLFDAQWTIQVLSNSEYQAQALAIQQETQKAQAALAAAQAKK